MDGGQLIAKVLAKNDVKFLFTLCGGHIAPIYIGAKQEGIRVIDVRHEANAVFAADAVFRSSGVPGVVTVTAGPGVTNTVTAVKNAAMAQSALVLLGGAAATVLKGRGSLQDIDQVSMLKSIVKWTATIKKYTDIVPILEKAFRQAQEGVPGPVFVECPIDLLYDEQLVREWYGVKNKEEQGGGIQNKLLKWYLKRHIDRMFSGNKQVSLPSSKQLVTVSNANDSNIDRVVQLLKKAQKPMMIIGSQAMLQPKRATELAKAIEQIGIPVYLSGMARGLMGADNPLQIRHHRKEALREADLILLAGVPCDFRLDYGRHLNTKATHIAVNRSKKELKLNKKPTVGLLQDPCNFLIDIGKKINNSTITKWRETLKGRDTQREINISQRANESVKGINPILLLRELDTLVDAKSILVADGGDFVAISSYTLHPRNPVSWLDPGVFGTLGVGAGFALGAKLCNPEAEVWIIYGDGSCAYSVAEFDTFKRHNIPVIALVGNDAAWSQIARDQVDIYKDDVATKLAHCDYDLVVKGYGGDGAKIDNMNNFKKVVESAKKSVQNGTPFLINAIIGKTDFRKGSISM